MSRGRGVRLIVPVGLEKLVPSVPKASRQLGHDNLYYQTGFQIGMLPLVNATVVTEIVAFRVLFGLDAVHVGGGGVSGSEGTVVLVATGEQAALDRAIAAVNTIKGEPPIVTMKAACATCVPTTPSLLATPAQQVPKTLKLSCQFQGKAEAELPANYTRRPGRAIGCRVAPHCRLGAHLILSSADETPRERASREVAMFGPALLRAVAVAVPLFAAAARMPRSPRYASTRPSRSSAATRSASRRL